LAGEIEGYACSRFSLCVQGGMTEKLGKDRGMSRGREVQMTRCGDDVRISRAMSAASGDDGSLPWLHLVELRLHLHGLRTVVHAILAAAERKLVFRATRKGERGRNQRKAEEEQQKYDEDASHNRSIAES
jgi:hypothetical protein